MAPAHSAKSVRRRVSRACDQCSIARTKCDGNEPCLRCLDLNNHCLYTRERKKRGKGSALYPTITKGRTRSHNGKTENTSPQPSHGHLATPVEVSVKIEIATSPSPENDFQDLFETCNEEKRVEKVLETLQNIPKLNDFSLSAHDSFEILQPFTSAQTNVDYSIPSSVASSISSSRISNNNSLSSAISSPPSCTSSYYPIVTPVLDKIAFLRPSLVKLLLETYCSDTSLCFIPIFRQSAILSSTTPRNCSPGLIFSMLLLAAHATPAYLVEEYDKAVQLLASLAVEHLAAVPIFNHGLDEVVAYTHLALVASTGRNKNLYCQRQMASQYWSQAFSLIRSLKYNQEHPEIDNEERREEMRRIWWFLFAMDRHLSLMHNRPLVLQDYECQQLRTPMNDLLWMGAIENISVLTENLSHTTIGPPIVLNYHNSPGFFGFFLPLMTILGGIRNVHMLELNKRSSKVEIKNMKALCMFQINELELSVLNYQNVARKEDENLHIWMEYMRCLLHIFCMLLHYYWDPRQTIRRDTEQLINDNNFDCCVYSMVQAARKVSSVRNMDPSLLLVPYYFPLYLGILSTSLLAAVHALEFRPLTKELMHATNVLKVANLRQSCGPNARGNFHAEYYKLAEETLATIQATPLSMEYRDELRHKRLDFLRRFSWHAEGLGWVT